MGAGRRFAGILAAAVLLAAPGAGAQSLEAPDSALRLTVQGDVPVAVLSALAAGWPLLLDDAIAWRDPALRDRAAVNAFDRVATRRWSPAAARASDGLLYGGVAGAFVAVSAEAVAHRHTARAWVIRSGVVAESVLVTAGLTQLVKYAVRRPRPVFYNPAAPRSAREGPDAGLSFWSGHTSLVASALASLATVQWIEEPGSPLAWTWTALAAAVVPATATLRVAAGKHYPSDVLAGAAAGLAAGIAVPLLHRWRPAVRGREVSVGTLAVPGGTGVVASMGW